MKLQSLAESLSIRTTYGLIVLGCLVGFSILVRLDEAAGRAEETRVQAQERLAQHGDQLGEEVWKARADEARSALGAWRATRWNGSTPGVIAAEIQGVLSRIASDARLEVLAAEVEPTPVETGGGAALRFRFSAQTPEGSSGIARALQDLSAHKPLIIVTEMNSTFPTRGIGRFSASGYALISLTAPEAPAGT
ncbi:MAG: hypothetical protein HC850_08580 [Rhodomicrobium sp.]|nr:hypothetical protein [Rhodomicrobium sp.]